MTITAANDTTAPIFQPIVSGDALYQEFQRWITELNNLSGEELAIRGAWTAGILIGVVVFLTLLRFAIRLVARWLSPKQEKDGESGKAARRNVGGLTMGAARFVAYLVAIGAILYVWGYDVRAGPLGQILSVVWRAGLILIVAIAVVEISDFSVTRLLHRGAKRSRDLRRAAQMRTLAPVLNGVINSLVVLIATMMVLSEVGLDIGPLIAGAGVIGIAIGFGAQSLVKDFLTGIFFIVEDIVSVGDIVRIADSSGLVEAMTLRTIRLRDFDGTLHIFPYGEAQVIHNLTKTFSYYVFNLSIAYSADIDKALELMQQVGDEMRTDEQYKAAIIAPIEVVGVDSLADSSVQLKARIKTQPGQQWTVGREYLKRIKRAFDANGIEIPFPHLKLVAPDAPFPSNEPTVTGK